MSKVMIGAIVTPSQSAYDFAKKQTGASTGPTGPSLAESGTKILDSLSTLFGRRNAPVITPTAPDDPYLRPAEGNGFLDSTPFGGQLKMKTVLLFAGLGLGGYLLYKNTKK